MSGEIRSGGRVERFDSSKEGERFAAFSCAIEFDAVGGVDPAMWEQYAFLSTVEGKVVVVVRPDGTVRIAEDATVGEAALAFWAAVAKHGAGLEQRRTDARAVRLRAIPRRRPIVDYDGDLAMEEHERGEWIQIDEAVAAASE